MSKRTFKPLKKTEWQKLDREVPKTGPNGRIVESVRIGVLYDHTNGTQEDLFEDIYADLLPRLLSVHHPLKMVVNITCRPRLVVFDGYDLLPHNPDMYGYIEQVESVLSGLDQDIYYRAYIKSWEMTAQRKPMDYAIKGVVQEINKRTSGAFPPELVISLMRKREAGLFLPLEEEDIRTDIAMLDEHELKIAAGDIVATSLYSGVFRSEQLKEILNNRTYENEDVVNAVVQEVFKRFILD